MSHPIFLENLHVSYAKKRSQRIQAVRGLSLTVQPGEVVGFLGPNGAGKSSTLKVLMGFVEPDSGTAQVFGLPAGSVESRRRIGYLPEVAMYYPFLTPVETLELYGALQGLRGPSLRKEIQHLLELLGIAEAGNRQNRTMSKGMLQRVGIAQSLLGSPELLILDEVTSGLDPVGRRELRSLLLERRKQGCTLFFSSHELAEVEMLCDRLILIDQGKLIAERELNSLKEELRQYTITYHGPDPATAAHASPTIDGARFATFHTKQELLAAVEDIQRASGVVLDITAQEGSLEDYFVETIGSAA